MSKPTTTEAMADIIKQARVMIPFNLSFDGFCVGECDRCPQKLLEVLETDLAIWEARLKKGVIPNLGDVHTLAKNCKDVYDILQNKDFIGCKPIDPDSPKD
jgi:hypothetical protein